MGARYVDSLDCRPVDTVRHAAPTLELTGQITLAGPASDIQDALDRAGLTHEVLDWEQIPDQKMAELDPKRWRKVQRERRTR